MGTQVLRRSREYLGAEGVGFGEGCPVPSVVGSGEWAVPSPEKFV